MYCLVVNYLIETYTTEHIIAETDRELQALSSRDTCSRSSLAMCFGRRYSGVCTFTTSTLSRKFSSKDYHCLLGRARHHTEVSTKAAPLQKLTYHVMWMTNCQATARPVEQPHTHRNNQDKSKYRQSNRCQGKFNNIRSSSNSTSRRPSSISRKEGPAVNKANERPSNNLTIPMISKMLLENVDCALFGRVGPSQSQMAAICHLMPCGYVQRSSETGWKA